MKSVLLLVLTVFYFQASAQVPRFRDTRLPVDTRIADLLRQLTLEEKIGLMGYQSKPVPRLGIPAYNWWNEALHGVARAGKATVFPQAIGMAATFNDSLLFEVASTISTEARAKYNLATRKGSRLQYMGLTFWSPNINIFRDPRWGRGQETYGEDPFLTSKMGSAFVRGMQGDDSRLLKTAATAKHFAVHSGPEAGRHAFNALVDEKDLRETYLYAFRALVDADVEAVMCAYNRVNGEPCCTGDVLLNRVLRKEWGFKGHVVTDCWALDDIFKAHKVMEGPVEVTAAAVKAGINMDCSGLLQGNVPTAIRQGLLQESDVDASLRPALSTLFRLGFFDPAGIDPWAKLGEADVHSEKAVQLARIAARQGMVLLKNVSGMLPLRKDAYRSIMVIGPNAAAPAPLLGNYHGVSTDHVSFLEGIMRSVDAGTLVQYEQGCTDLDTLHFAGEWAAGMCDLTIAVLGLTPLTEGEEGDAFLSKGGDRESLGLPRAQIKLLQRLKANGKPIVVILTGGSALDVAEVAPYADAILLAWYPGEQGGMAAADLLFGRYSPSGRLPVSFYRSLGDLPGYSDYSMKGRTYRYYAGPVQYPFGFGLSYTRFAYAWKQQPRVDGQTIRCSVEVANTGSMAGDEVVQAYVQYPDGERMPVRELKAFRRVSVDKGKMRVVDLEIPLSDLRKWDLSSGSWKLYPGSYRIVVGSHSEDRRLEAALVL